MSKSTFIFKVKSKDIWGENSVCIGTRRAIQRYQYIFLKYLDACIDSSFFLPAYSIIFMLINDTDPHRICKNDQPLFDVFGNRLLENLWDNYVCCYFTGSDITISLIHSHHYITLLIQWKKKNLHVKPILSLKKSKISLLLKIPKI